MGEQRRWSDADRELVAGVLHQEGCEDPCPGNCANDARAVLDALAAAGWRDVHAYMSAATEALRRMISGEEPSQWMAQRLAENRAQAGEDAARALEALAPSPELTEAAQVVRQVTGSTEGAP